MSLATPKPCVFLSYSHKDEPWKDRLKVHLRVLEQVGALAVWDDREIDAGETWYDEIQRAMDNAEVAVCLISADYLASDFCTKEEVPYLLERRASHGMHLIPVLLRPCPWKAVSWLKAIQMLPRDGKAVLKDYRDNEDEVFSAVAELVLEHVGMGEADPVRSPHGYSTSGRVRSFGNRADSDLPPPPTPPVRVEISRLPMTGAVAFGRQAELSWLDQLWDEGSVRIASLVAWGGVGKSTLVNKWLESLAAEGWRGARRVYGWSFYSQGTGSRATSADELIQDALSCFGDPDPAAGSPWAKGERLAELIRQEKTLLVLDGIEPLQSTIEGEQRQIKDPALATLLAELGRPAIEPWGLCILTSREKVADLERFPEAVGHKNLDQISVEAGRALLRIGGVQGTDAELEKASRSFGNHALAVNLLAGYLQDVPGHPADAAATIPDLEIPEEAGRHPRRMVEAFARRFGPGPELELLLTLGLFDRPASREAIDAVCAGPAIAGLTEHLTGMPERGFQRLVERLRSLKLLAKPDPQAAEDLDAHPLVREHFGERLRIDAPLAWREAHARLWRHYAQSTRDLPETVQEMAPLYAAIAHGCKAGRYQECLDEIYRRRIARGDQGYSVYSLGLVSADLGALLSFFVPGELRPVEALDPAGRIFVLERAGLFLRSLGRRGAISVLRAGLDLAVAEEQWRYAEKCVRHLSSYYRTAGELQAALEHAEESVLLADRSGDRFYRVASRTRVGQALFYLGCLKEAEETFRLAEALQAELDPGVPWLYSYGGSQYCELLLDLGRYEEVLERVERSFAKLPRRYPIFDEARDWLIRGGARLQQVGGGRSELAGDARRDLEDAIGAAQKVGDQPLFLTALLARAELQRLIGELERARATLDKIGLLAARHGMRLFEADCQLASARLSLAEGDPERARESLARARTLIDEMGYHRRDRQVAELEIQLPDSYAALRAARRG